MFVWGWSRITLFSPLITFHCSTFSHLICHNTPFHTDWNIMRKPCKLCRKEEIIVLVISKGVGVIWRAAWGRGDTISASWFSPGKKTLEKQHLNAHLWLHLTAAFINLLLTNGAPQTKPTALPVPLNSSNPTTHFYSVYHALRAAWKRLSYQNIQTNKLTEQPQLTAGKSKWLNIRTTN